MVDISGAVKFLQEAIRIGALLYNQGKDIAPLAQKGVEVIQASVSPTAADWEWLKAERAKAEAALQEPVAGLNEPTPEFIAKVTEQIAEATKDALEKP